MPRAKNLDELDEAALANLDDSSDEDYDNTASHRSPKKKPRPTAPRQKVEKRRRANSYGSDDEEEDDVIEEEWSAEDSFEEEEQVERTKSGRPARGAAKKAVTYEESDEEEEEALFTDGEDSAPPTPKKAKGGKKPAAKSRFASKKAAGRRGRRAAQIEDSEEELDDDDVEEEEEEVVGTPPKRPRLIVKLKTPARHAQDDDDSPPPQNQRRSSRLHDTGDPLVELTNSGHHALPQPARGKTASPKGRNSRSRSAGLRDRATTPATTTNRRTTRAGSAALRASVPPPEPDDEEDDEDTTMIIAKTEPEDDPGMSRITEESSLLNSSAVVPSESTSRNHLTNGTTSVDKGDGSFEPGETTTSNNQDSLEASIPAREQGGLLTAKGLEEDNGARRTRSSVLHNTQAEAEDIDNIAGGEENPDTMDVDSDEQPVSNRRRLTRLASRVKETAVEQHSSKGKKKAQRGSDDESYNGEDDGSGSDEESGREASKGAEASDDDGKRKSNRLQSKRKRSSPEVNIEDELREEAAELRPQKRSRIDRFLESHSQDIDSDGGSRSRRAKNKVIDYRLFRPEALNNLEEPSSPPASSSNRGGGKRGGAGSSGFKSLFNTIGPFGGIGQGPAILGFGKTAAGMGGADSDDSDDDDGLLATGGAVSGPLSSGGPRNSLSGGRPSAVGPGGTPANLGKITGKQKQLLADADPLGVDPNVDFSKVGGLGDHINQLTEMVALPLMYPEVFQNMKITPPRGVLFHGPPGTGKTLLARALATSCSTEGRKISFYMRKGADCLSKWVGEAERQLRLLFDEARNNQPSIIFFDEIDGLAPVRSSKQEQIHASIVSTLLALMDGMDGRGQVIVIGATNRPDSVDPALRRPGRFDREFYFPLPGKEARKSIINIHTDGWPPLTDEFKDELAMLTKGYGGADLRALCTEASLNAIQRKYPQIYKDTSKKYKIDPKSIKVTPRDFMISLQKIVPSSERSSSSGAAPLPEQIEPLLGPVLAEIKAKIAEVLPQKKRMTALEEAEYELDNDADGGFARERMMRDFEGSRIFKPRLLVHGAQGMGQNYIGGAVLHHFEGFHVQTVSLPILMGDSTRNAEATLVQIFIELKRHKPSVLFIPDFNNWYSSVGHDLIKTFQHLLNSIGPSDPILLFGVLNEELTRVDPEILREYFGYSRKGRVAISKPDAGQRERYFQNVLGHIKKSPRDFPDPSTRPKRKLPELEVVPMALEKEPTREEKEATKKQEKYLIHLLKCRLMPLIDMLKQKYKRFKRPVIPNDKVKRAYELKQQQEAGETIGSDLQPVVYEGIEVVDLPGGLIGVRDIQTNITYYNLDLEVIEDRVFNGYYETTEMFTTDLKYLQKDAEASKDRQSEKEGKEMFTNVVISVHEIETADPNLMEQLQKAHSARKERRKKRAEAKRTDGADQRNTTETPVTFTHPFTAAGSSIPQKRNFRDMMNPQTPQGQMQRQLMETLPEETSPSNGYIASSEMGDSSKKGDGDGDLVMSDHGSNATVQPPAAGSHQSALVHTTQSESHQLVTASMARQDSTQTANTIANLMSQVTRASVGVHVSASQAAMEAAVKAASTTPSVQKTTDESQASGQKPDSGPLEFDSNPPREMHSRAQETNNSHPEILFGTPAQGDSQLPDTQVYPSSESSGNQSQMFHHAMTQNYTANFSQSNSHPSQHSAVIPAVSSQLPHPSPSNNFFRPPPPRKFDPPVDLDEDKLAALQETIVEQTQDFTIEQLEQVNAALMKLVWEHRDKWNRNVIVQEADAILSEVLEDIKEYNGLVAGWHQEEQRQQQPMASLSFLEQGRRR